MISKMIINKNLKGHVLVRKKERCNLGIVYLLTVITSNAHFNYYVPNQPLSFYDFPYDLTGLKLHL